MAGTAGVVNDPGLGNDAAFAALIAASSTEVQDLARAVRDLVSTSCLKRLRSSGPTNVRSAGVRDPTSSPTSSPT